jgi:hypothetical protein
MGSSNVFDSRGYRRRPAGGQGVDRRHAGVRSPYTAQWFVLCSCMKTFRVVQISSKFGGEAWHVLTEETAGSECPMVTFATEIEAQALAENLTGLETQDEPQTPPAPRPAPGRMSLFRR